MAGRIIAPVACGFNPAVVRWTEVEFRPPYEAAGFRLTRIVSIDGDPGVVEGVPMSGRAMPGLGTTRKALGRCGFATLFVVAGVGHVVAPDAYVRIMPPYLPWHRPLVLVSGCFEVALGVLLLIPRTTRFAAWGLIALLVAVFPANVHMYLHQELWPLPPVVHLLRLPLQAVFILWAYAYTGRSMTP